jgi:glycine cleavage system H protein
MRKFAKTHEWYEDLGAGKVKIGISKHAAHELSDVVFIELPDVGKKLADKQSLCVLESVKAVADAYSPAGTVVEVNTKLKDQAGLINQDPEGAGWIAIVQLDKANALDEYLTEEQYLSTLH